MPIKALQVLNYSGTIIEPGELLSGLSAEEESEIETLGVGVIVPGDEPTKLVDPIAALSATLKSITKLDLLSYADKAEIQVEDGKKDDIIAVIIADAQANGTNIDAFSATQLRKFVDTLGIEYDKDASHEELLAVVAQHFTVLEGAADGVQG